ncbi:putative pre-16S rRNA nuclease [Clostridia bacterium]|nr:putative pre-16S rRNA nuclease [Clostridia bacterium]
MRILSVDYGDRYTGVAVCDEGEVIASPLCVICDKILQSCAEKTAALVTAESAGLIVVGNPLNMDGTEGFRSRKSVRFANTVRELVTVPVILHDERGSTLDAGELLEETGRRKKNRHGKVKNIDAAAAAVILKSYLDEKNG